MPKELESLTTEDQKVLMDAVPYITILVAGADGDIDMREVHWSEKLTKIRSFSYEEELRPFYKKVGEHYDERLHQLMDNLPKDTDSRNQIITEELSKLNTILPKLDHFYARLYYLSLKSFADHVAHASGGVMGWLSVGFEEYKVVDLHMIDPVE
ncbi:hypothetical protein [Flavilitoribacter nigricans]|uniref:Uncharacterized protein n=1 Tax=Flavilitoribacter nigricans (strain ATCC 23147 / DSM 23189 / NBRC 102662 / NCIMB 1420 / SS-2) TaxID=1122177 RepID=A0A2D0NDX2_FLAN2|nr:hypothetical protein [Flavilitoribacter nigricans]PHN06692.1 hypothetical protein CRP01_10370 [Flavilitoribacter nigricans DSM 23189 = NBRC 102662]